MHALTPVRGDITKARLRLACAAAMLLLLAALLIVPMCDKAYWVGERCLAADRDLSRLIQAIMELDVDEARRLLGHRPIDLNGLSAYGTNPLWHAIAVHAQQGGEPFAPLLLAHGANLNGANA